MTVRPKPPAALAPLERLIRNMRWTWHAPTQDLFAEIDPQAWVALGRNPMRLLGAVSVSRLVELASDQAFLDRMHDLDADLLAYLTSPGWYAEQQNAPDSPPNPDAIAYFSMEFGLSDVLPNFSGGLGVLAGDHLKSASDLGVPLIGVGLLYQYGYFSQSLSADGWQLETYPTNDTYALPVERATAPDGTDLTISVSMPGGREMTARIWLVRAGRIPLLLLDTDIEANEIELRHTTDRLYGGDQDHRIKQEILLGVGGARAVRAFCAVSGYPEPEVFHMNEGHAGFSGLERMRTLVDEQHLTVEQALAAVRAGTVFTTHTPVPAGIDRFPMDLVRHYLDADEAGVSRLLPGIPVQDVLELGGEADPGRFNMAHLGLRLAQRANGVAKLHGAVSRRMFADLYPGFDVEEVPIGSVTNGVHLPTWQAREIGPIASDLADWRDLASAEDWPRTDLVDAGRLWAARNELRSRLVTMARLAVRESWLQRGRAEAELGWTESILDPDILTIGFARRVSTYKRLTLMLRDRDRLKAILLNPDRPVQIVIAGKAHPADDGGKRFMQEMVRFSDDPEIRRRIAYLPNYNMTMASVLCAGADVWMNTPIRPQEASGTSGMKAALNGVLNLSISDGWWDELYDGHNGWTIPSVGGLDDDRRDDLEASALYDILTDRVVPLFYQREGGIPVGWVDAVRHTLSYLGPRVQATRMVRDYVREYYGPAVGMTRAMTATGDWTVAKDFAAWQDRVRAAWPGIRIAGVDLSSEESEPVLGHPMTVRAYLELGGLLPDDVSVEAVFGRIGADQELTSARHYPMTFVGNGDGFRFQAEVPLERAGALGYTVRVVPKHPMLASPAEMGLATLAS